MYNKTLRQSTVLYHTAVITFGVALLYLSTIATPTSFRGIPVTLQTICVIFISLYYTPYQAASTLALYLFSRLTGIPTIPGIPFGLTAFIKPAGGYLVGMLVGTCMVSYLRTRFRTRSGLSLVIYSLTCLAAIYTFGLLHLTYCLHSFNKAVSVGLVPFIVPEIYKMIILYSVIIAINSVKRKKIE